ncbi:MAG: hypothetical protein WCL07_01100 [bacterium]
MERKIHISELDRKSWDNVPTFSGDFFYFFENGQQEIQGWIDRPELPDKIANLDEKTILIEPIEPAKIVVNLKTPYVLKEGVDYPSREQLLKMAYLFLQNHSNIVGRDGFLMTRAERIRLDKSGEKKERARLSKQRKREKWNKGQSEQTVFMAKNNDEEKLFVRDEEHRTIVAESNRPKRLTKDERKEKRTQKKILKEEKRQARLAVQKKSVVFAAVESVPWHRLQRPYFKFVSGPFEKFMNNLGDDRRINPPQKFGVRKNLGDLEV